MIAIALVLVQAAPALPGPIGRQALPAKGCAAYLWSRGPTPALVAMAAAEPPALRLTLDGRTADHPRDGEADGDAGLGFARRTEYRLPSGIATLDLTLAIRPDLGQGAAVTDATLTIRRGEADTVVLPLGGLVGCAAPAR